MLKRLLFKAAMVFSLVALTLGGGAAFDWH